jgi:bifunctional non-homologous end joining protein LigD
VPGQAIVDGEVVVVHEGRTNFSELQAELAAGRQDRLLYYAFDLLWLDGQDLRNNDEVRASSTIPARRSLRMRSFSNTMTTAAT